MSLQEQLDRVGEFAEARGGGGGGATGGVERVQSLIHSSSHAATLEREEVRAAAAAAFDQLCLVSEHMQKHHRLFSPVTVDLDRRTQTEAQNKKLNDRIRKFLFAVSPYYQLPAAQLAVDWLVRRYTVHLDNVGDMVRCILPYHSTKTFARTVQILKIKGSREWAWLSEVAKEGAPMPRPALVKTAASNRAVLRLICQAVQEAVLAGTPAQSAHYVTLFVPRTSPCPIYTLFATSSVEFNTPAPEKLTPQPFLRVYPTVGRFASILCGVLATPASEDQLQVIMPYITAGLETSRSPALQAATRMVVCQLAAHTNLDEETTAALVDSVACTFDNDSVDDALKCLVGVTQTQHLSKIPGEAFRRLVKVDELPTRFDSICREFEAGKLLRLFVESLLDALDQHRGHEELLLRIVRDVKITAKLAKSIGLNVATRYQTAASKVNESEDVDDAAFARLKDFTREVMGMIDRQHPRSMDLVLRKILTKTAEQPSAGHKQRAGKPTEFLELAVGGLRHQPLPSTGTNHTSTTLLLGLEHPEASVRELAITELRKVLSDAEVTPADREYLAAALEHRLRDDDSAVIRGALALGAVLSDIVATDVLLDAAANAFSGKCQPKVASGFCSHMTAHILSREAEIGGEVGWKITCIILPRLVASPKPKVAKALVDTLAQVAPGKNPPLFGSMRKLATNAAWASLEKGASAEIVTAANQALFSQLARNLVREGSAFQSALDALCMNFCQSESESMRHIGLTVLCETLVIATKQPMINLIVQRLSSVLGTMMSKLSFRTHSIFSVPEMACSLQGRLTETFDSIYDVFPSVCQTTLSEQDAVQQYLCYFLHLILGAEAPNSTELFDSTAVEIFATLTSNSTASLRSFGNLVQIFFARLVPVDPLDFCIGLWRRSQIGATSRLRALEIVDVALQAIGVVNVIESDLFHRLLSAVLCLVVFSGDSASLTRTQSLHALTAISKLLSECRCENPVDDAVRKNLESFVSAMVFQSQETVSHDDVQCVAILGRLLSHKAQKFSDNILQLFVEEAFSSDAAPAYRFEVNRVLGNVISPVKFWRYWDHLVSFACNTALTARSEDSSPDINRELAHAAIGALDLTTIKYFNGVKQGGNEAKKHGFASEAEKVLSTWLAAGDDESSTPCMWFLERLEAQNLLNELSPKDRTAIFPPLSKLYGKTSGSDIGALLKRVLASLHVEAIEIVSVLEAALTSSAEVAVNGSSDEDPETTPSSSAPVSDRKSKRRRVEAADVDLRSLSTEYILTTEYVLEILQFKDATTIGHSELLFGPLFDLLTYCLGLSPETQFAVEHIKQTVLDILSSLCRDIDQAAIPKKSLNAETIVKCIKSTHNPQTHQYSLLLLSRIAEIAPEGVLQSIMPIFTFMGTTMLKQDDNYAFQVVESTIDTIVPALVNEQKAAAESRGAARRVDRVVPVVAIFVDALDHIPKHRSLKLFVKLLATLGSSEYLYVFVGLLLKRVVLADKGTETADIEEDDNPLVFCRTLCSQFSATDQLRCMEALLVNFHTLSKETATKGKRSSKALSSLQRQFVAPGEHTPKQVRHFGYLALSFVASNLAAPTFNHAVVGMEVEAEEAETAMTEDGEPGPNNEATEAVVLAQKSILGIMESSLSSVLFVSSFRASLDQGDGSQRFWKVIERKLYDINDRTNGLLKVEKFAEVVRSLLNKTEDATLQQKAVLLLTDRIKGDDSPTNRSIELYLGLAAELVGLCRGGASGDTELAQSALFALTVLVVRFGSDFSGWPNGFEELKSLVLSVLQEGEKSVPELKSNAAVLFGAMCLIRGPASVEFLPAVLPLLTKTLNEAARNGAGGEPEWLQLQQCAVSAISAAVDAAPQFMGPYLEEILMITASNAFSEAGSPVASQAASAISAARIRAAVSSAVPARVALPALYATCANLTAHRDKTAVPSLVRVLETLQRVVMGMSAVDVGAHSKAIFKFLLSMFNFRTEFKKFGSSAHDQVETAAIEVFAKLVLRLSDTAFRPMLWKLIGWSGDGAARAHTVLRAAHALMCELKSLFLPYFSHLLKMCVEALTTRESTPLAASSMTVVLQLLREGFLHDAGGGFVTDERFKMLGDPILSQLNFRPDVEDDDAYLERIREFVAPCIAQLASSATGVGMQKDINDAIVALYNSPRTAVRVGALVATEEVYKSAGSVFIGFLPDTLSLFTELLEDEAAPVEAQARKVRRMIESELGETLDAYLGK